jgi:ankyrin repeat protein
LVTFIYIFLGVSVSQNNNKGNQPIHTAAKLGEKEAIVELLEINKNVLNEKNKTVTQKAGRKNLLKFVKKFAEHGADLNAQDENGRVYLILQTC